jgi:hypothetical protein
MGEAHLGFAHGKYELDVDEEPDCGGYARDHHCMLGKAVNHEEVAG